MDFGEGSPRNRGTAARASMAAKKKAEAVFFIVLFSRMLVYDWKAMVYTLLRHLRSAPLLPIAICAAFMSFFAYVAFWVGPCR